MIIPNERSLCAPNLFTQVFIDKAVTLAESPSYLTVRDTSLEFPDTNGFQVHPMLLDFQRFTPKAFNNIALGHGASPRTLGRTIE